MGNVQKNQRDMNEIRVISEFTSSNFANSLTLQTSLVLDSRIFQKKKYFLRIFLFNNCSHYVNELKRIRSQLRCTWKTWGKFRKSHEPSSYFYYFKVVIFRWSILMAGLNFFILGNVNWIRRVWRVLRWVWRNWSIWRCWH